MADPDRDPKRTAGSGNPATLNPLSPLAVPSLLKPRPLNGIQGRARPAINRHAHDLLTRPDNTVSLIAWLLGTSRATICEYVSGLPARTRLAGALPRGPE